MDDETLTAYHEAGHAVVAYAMGGSIESMQLWGEADDYLPERFGDCRVAWGRVDPKADWQTQREIITTLAGPVAEMIYRDEKLHPAVYGPWKHDWETAFGIANRMVPDAVRCTRILEQATIMLHHEIQREPCWPAIAALADELEAHEMLDSEQITEVLQFWLGR